MSPDRTPPPDARPVVSRHQDLDDSWLLIVPAKKAHLIGNLVDLSPIDIDLKLHEAEVEELLERSASPSSHPLPNPPPSWRGREQSLARTSLSPGGRGGAKRG